MKWLLAFLAKLLKPAPQPDPSPSGNRLLDEINRARAANGRQPLKHSQCLTDQAFQWSAEMRRAGRMSHDGYQQRLNNCGMQAGGEVVAAGQRTEAEAVSAWMGSPGHRSILLSDYEYAGAGGSGNYWCALAGDSSLYFAAA